MIPGRKSPRRLYRSNIMPNDGISFNEKILKEARRTKTENIEIEVSNKSSQVIFKDLDVIEESGRSSINTQYSPNYDDSYMYRGSENFEDKENRVEFDNMSATRGYCLKCKKRVNIVISEKKKGWLSFCCMSNSDKHNVVKMCSRCLNIINQSVAY